MEHINEIGSVGTRALSTYRISVDKAAELVASYVKEFKQNPNMPKILGGTIELDALHQLEDKLQMDPPYKGLACWFCWKKASNPQDTKLFLALEMHNNFNLDCADEPDYPELARPADVFKYNGDETEDDIKKLIKTDRRDRSNHQYPSLIKKGFNRTDPGTVLKLNHDFKIHGPRDRNGNFYNECGYGFFENEITREVNELLKYSNGIDRIRYYFGYDKDESINKIRIVLIAVDKDGNNMEPYRDDVVVSRGPYILQKSWPPHS